MTSFPAPFAHLVFALREVYDMMHFAHLCHRDDATTRKHVTKSMQKEASHEFAELMRSL